MSGGGEERERQQVGGRPKTTSSQAESVQTSRAAGRRWHSRAEKIQQRVTDLEMQKQMREAGGRHVTHVQRQRARSKHGE